MSGPNPGRKRPAGRAKGRQAKRRRLAAASQQLQAPVPASLAQPTGDVQNPPADTFQAGALPADGAYIVRFPQGEQSGDGVCLGRTGGGVGGGGKGSRDECWEGGGEDTSNVTGRLTD